MEETTTETVNVEAIMQTIRQQIMEKKATESKDAPLISVDGKRFPPEFYEHLYQAGLTYDQTFIKLHTTKSSVPLIGPFIDFLRQKVHELVVFYVNQMAADQIRVNTHLLKAISIMSETLEEDE